MLDPYQIDCQDCCYSRYQAGVYRQLCVLATGGGKTVVAATMPARFGFTKRKLFLTHRIKLAHQTAKQITAWNPGATVGIEMGNLYSSDMFPEEWVIGSVRSLGAKGSDRLRRFDPADFDLVIDDECHHLGNDKDWQRIHAHFGLDKPDTGGILSIGITATPERGDGLGLDGFYDEIVYKWMLWPHAIEQGYLVPPSVEVVKTNVDLDGVPWVAGKWNEKELAKEINTDRRNKLIVMAWMKHAMDLKTLVFTEDIQHAVDLAGAFKAHGITAEAIWGADKDQDAKFLRYDSGETTVLLNCALTIEGWDDPSVRCIVLASPNGNPSPVWQKIGRGTRIEAHIRQLYRTLHAARAAGVPIAKETLIVLDVCDNCTKHPPITVASLFGLPRDLDMRGASVGKVKKEFERIAREFPEADVSNIKDIGQLKTLTEHLDLFKIHEPPEIHRLTRVVGWRKSGEGYMIANHGGVLEIRQDLLGKFAVTGNMQGRIVSDQSQSLEGAFNVADRIVVDVVGRGLAFKDAKWRNDPPSDKMIELARNKGITIIPKTAGELSNAINAKKNEPASPQHIRFARNLGITDIPDGASKAFVSNLIDEAKKRRSDQTKGVTA